MKDPEKDIKDQIVRLTDPTIRDEKKVLETIVDAITDKYVDKDLVKSAVRQALFNYEDQLRTFMVATATRQLKRVVNLINSLDTLEDRLNDPEVIANMRAQDLIRAYAIQQSSLMQSLDYVKKVADMRIELQQATAAITSSLTNHDSREIEHLSGLPKLTSQQRSTVRSLVEGMISSIDADYEETESDADVSTVP